MKICLFAMPPRISSRALVNALKNQFVIDVEPERIIQRTYMDTYDRQMLENDTVLEWIEEGSNTKLVWRSLRSGYPLGEQRVPQAPRFMRDLPRRQFRGKIESITGIRALLPLATLTSRTKGINVLDSNKKRVLRLEIQQDRALPENRTEPYRTPSRIGVRRVQLLAMRGYGQAFERVRDRLIDVCQLAPMSHDPVYEALEASGEKRTIPRAAPQIEPSQRTDTAVTAILLQWLDVIEFNEPGVRGDVDTECLHDLRLAVRRTRSLLGQIKKTFPARRAERFGKDLAWIGYVTGPTRDMDVYLLAFEGFKSQLPKPLRDDLEPLRCYLQRHQNIEQQALVRALNSARYRRLKRDWRVFLEAPVPRRPTSPNAVRAIADVAAEHIARIYKKLKKEGKRLHPDSPAADFHDLRKTCKKIRYLIEFFKDLYPDVRAKKLIAQLKQLQASLGAFQDLQVQQNSLSRYRADMLAEHSLTPRCDSAFDLLIESLASHENELKRNCMLVWKRFIRCAERDAFSNLLRQQKRTAVTVH